MVASKLVSVCLPLPVRTSFTYRVPDPLQEGLSRGRRVRVPFGPRTMDGWCIGFPDEAEGAHGDRELKAVTEILDDGPLLDAGMMDVALWISETYACSWGEALTACVPAGVRSGATEATVRTATLTVSLDAAEAEAARLSEKQIKRSRVLRLLIEHPEGLAVRDLARSAQCTESPVLTLVKHGFVSIQERRVSRDPFAGREPEPPADVAPNAEQLRALEAIGASVAAGTHEAFLLHGVTGSGKTEVYLRAIDQVVSNGKKAIVLVPEIALTPQTVARFRGWFERVAVLHSALTDAERRNQWHLIRAGGADVVIGPRSAILAPLPDLGIVVVDEEHEPSFKQQSAPRYNARSVALERGRRAGCPVVLGSATPALETYAAAVQGELTLLSLPRRAGPGRMPIVDVVDMAREHRDTKRRNLLSRRLVEIVRRALNRDEQAILLLNRRGFATSVYCTRCGHTLACDRCSVMLTFHRVNGTVLCHPCGREHRMPTSCSECHIPGLSRLGAGTERLEDAVHFVFPGARIARMDSDAMHDRAAYENVLGRFRRREVDILLGTQMIAKGLDFPRVTAVGVVSADTSLMVPDFRAAERTFQLVSQVAGRAGRADRPGTVVVQTVQPRHAALMRAREHDYEGFARDELTDRARTGWPPSTRLVRVVAQAKDDAAARRRAQEVADVLRDSLPPGSADVLGPARCPIGRVRGRQRWHVVLRAADEPVQRAAVLRLSRVTARARGAEITIDVDPVDLT